MLDFHNNPAIVLGIGLSANVLGVLIGGLIGNAIVSEEIKTFNSTLLALAVVCVTIALLPPLHRHLSSLLKDHAYLAEFSEMSPGEQNKITDRFVKFANLSERETQLHPCSFRKKRIKQLPVSCLSVKTR